jgi:hypothetical protein
MFGIGEAVAAGLKVIDKFVPDPALKIKMENELRKDLLAADLAQMKVNAVEASHRSIFIAGWRPCVGWVCALAFAMHFLIMPLLMVASIYLDFTPPVIDFDMEALMSIMMGMLGIAGMRSFEKIKGITK